MTGGALLGLLMLLVMIGAIFIGFPISFTLLFSALAFGYLGMGESVFDLAYLQTIGMMKEELLAAVPLFILMGFITEQAGLMERLFLAFRLLLAPLRGALFLVVILTSTLFAMATGIVGAAVTVLGIMAAPIMVKSGYDARLSAGAITAGGTLGVLIPPSVMLIVMGPVLSVSVADLYAAAFGPGFLLAGLYTVYLLGRSFADPSLGPPVPLAERAHSSAVVLRELALGVLPLLWLIASTLGTILAGWATPTEASGIGALGALLLALAYRKLSLASLRRALHSTMVTSSMVLLLAVTSNIFGAVFSRLGTATWITQTLLELPLPPLGMLALVVSLIFLLGWPFEWPAIVLVFLPIFQPVVAALHFDMVWFGALVAVVLQTAYLSPPVAMSAYYLKQVVREWSLATIYRGMFEFMALQVVAIALIITFPGIATWFPEYLRAQTQEQTAPFAPGLEPQDRDGPEGGPLAPQRPTDPRMPQPLDSLEDGDVLPSAPRRRSELAPAPKKERNHG
jgi:tripartite ATP-independent transporter DctM subunit